MSETPSDVQYVVRFVDGPFEGRVEHRVLRGGTPEPEISELGSVGGQERLYWYVAGESRHVGDVLHVSYSFDKRDSDPVEDDNGEVDSLRF
ncbi:MAG: hypothetical protein JWR33_432 [Naasia sp.]|jgi:hypothetical protein|uniref:hypothetical protein n=1 Tax=Naasia sp. TaxID=2546198 RepID=UPI002616B77A|nr:hypothetical protein [Naasia sp.]MCU1569691.1 hypothetical protein [Naasia sp.]